MPNYCVVGGCKNETNRELGISVWPFPKDRKIRAQWVRFVRINRADFREPALTNRSSGICNRHFSDDVYAYIPDLQSQQMSGYHCRRGLKRRDDAVPTILYPCQTPPPPGPGQHTDCDPSNQSTPTTSKGTGTKMKGAARKRERMRLVEEALASFSESVPPASLDTTAGSIDQPASPDSMDVDANVPAKDLKTGHLVRSQTIVTSFPPSDKVSQSVQCRRVIRVPKRSKHVQVDSEEMSVPVLDSINSPILESTPIKRKEPPAPEPEEDESLEKSSVSFVDCEENDPTWNPNMSANSVNSDHLSKRARMEDPATQKMFIVSEARLLELFRVCKYCGYIGAEGSISSIEGSMITVKQYCISCDEEWKWKSQEMVGNYPAGNIGLSTAILAAGAIPSKVLRVLDFWGVQGITPQTFFLHQKNFLHQAIRNVWEEESKETISSLGQVAKLAGDARCDSMGHCAKYGSYSLHDTDGNKIVVTHLVQSTEVKNSYHMELEGLQRCVKDVEEGKPNQQIELITDGHMSVAKWLRENKGNNITHFFDIWHVAKGLRKKLTKLGKKFPQVLKWIKSIINHLYWCAVTSDNNKELILAKWKSIANHVANTHKHDNVLFPKCVHKRLGKGRQWFKTSSEEYDKLCSILLNAKFLKSVGKLSSNGQTSGLEGYHSLVIHFAPKMYHFGYNGMKSRLQMAALHFNENAGREQAINKDGSARFNMRNPKNRHGDFIVATVASTVTFGYVQKFASEVRRLVASGETHRVTVNDPPPLCAKFERPPKEEAVAKRFNFARFYKKT